MYFYLAKFLVFSPRMGLGTSDCKVLLHVGPVYIDLVVLHFQLLVLNTTKMLLRTPDGPITEV